MVSLMRLDAEKYRHAIMEMLGDARAGIAKTAGVLMMKTGILDYERVMEIFCDAVCKHTKLRCMDILFAAPKWQSIVDMLKSVSNDEEYIRGKALVAINRWLRRFNHSYVLPSEKQSAEIRALICLANGILSPDIEKELYLVLR
jgi:hypothetical protein